MVHKNGGFNAIKWKAEMQQLHEQQIEAEAKKIERTTYTVAAIILLVIIVGPTYEFLKAPNLQNGCCDIHTMAYEQHLKQFNK